MMELSVVLPMYGRVDAGHNATIATHQLLATTRVTAAAPSCTIRRPSLGGPATRYTRMNAGRTKNAWSIFVLNAKPRSNADISRPRVRPVSTADHNAHAAPRHNNVSSASGLL